MKRIEFCVRYLEDTLRNITKDFTLSDVELEEDESPIDEASYYKGFLDCISYLTKCEEEKNEL